MSNANFHTLDTLGTLLVVSGFDHTVLGSYRGHITVAAAFAAIESGWSFNGNVELVFIVGAPVNPELINGWEPAKLTEIPGEALFYVYPGDNDLEIALFIGGGELSCESPLAEVYGFSPAVYVDGVTRPWYPVE